jgi:hypothetical protein
MLRPRSAPLLLSLLVFALAGCSDDGVEQPLDLAPDLAADMSVDGPLRPSEDICAQATYMTLGCRSGVDAGLQDAGDHDGGASDGGKKKDSGGLTCITVAGSTVGAQNRFELPGGACGLGTSASGPDLFYKIYVSSQGGGVIEFKSDFKSVLYFLDASCSGACRMGFKTSQLKTSLPASGDYIVVVDGETAADKGSFALYLYQPGG